MSLEDIKKVRLEKLAKIKEKGIDPYPAKTQRTHYINEVIENFDKFVASAETVILVGRVMSMRGQGAIIFFDIFDGSLPVGKFQGILKKEDLEGDGFDFWNEVVDIGDFVEVSGTIFATKRGEKTIAVKSWKMVSKTLLPLPEKWHGLQDTEERYRKRYLDILGNTELRDLFVLKAKFWDVTRAFLKNKGFLEVETPSLELTTGGAEARPFKTHHNDYDIDVFMRISVGELWQKRLMSAGMPKTFEIGKIYRNEGSSPEHLQEFTNMEFYWGYADYEDGMSLVAEMYRTIAKEVFGKTDFSHRGYTFDLANEWKKIDYREEIKNQTGVDIDKASDEDIKNKLKELGVKYDGENRERLTDTIWKYCRKSIGGPAFLVNHPRLVAPLAKASVDNPNTVQMFQPLIAGSEVGRGYSELNDPIDQMDRFKIQQSLVDKGDDEAMMADFEFVEMLEHGMPPTCGFGFGERFFAILADKPLRETVLFPFMKPKGE